jgi:uncharacterized protein with ATP-grasp and redox domains
MGKVKQWAEDMAEEYLDSLESKVKSRTISIDQAVDIAKKSDVDFALIGFDEYDFENDLYCYLSDSLNQKGMEVLQ